MEPKVWRKCSNELFNPLKICQRNKKFERKKLTRSYLIRVSGSKGWLVSLCSEPESVLERFLLFQTPSQENGKRDERKVTLYPLAFYPPDVKERKSLVFVPDQPTEPNFRGFRGSSASWLNHRDWGLKGCWWLCEQVGSSRSTNQPFEHVIVVTFTPWRFWYYFKPLRLFNPLKRDPLKDVHPLPLFSLIPSNRLKPLKSTALFPDPNWFPFQAIFGRKTAQKRIARIPHARPIHSLTFIQLRRKSE